MIVLTPSLWLSFGLLTAAVLSVWLPPIRVFAIRLPLWPGLLLAALLAAGAAGFVTPAGIAVVALTAGLCSLVRARTFPLWVRAGAGVALTATVAALFIHALPFFQNPRVFDAVTLGAGVPPYSKHWNLDKAVAGLLLLAFFGDICKSKTEWVHLFKRAWPVAVLTVGVSIVAAWATGYIEPQWHPTRLFFLWAWANLFFTCVAEEMLFRGVVQKHLVMCFQKPAAKIAVVVAVGILFGLAHIAGGWVYAALAAVAGIGYGLAYHLTGRIEAAVLTHFTLNSAHFLFFTYPYAVG